jgi:hypothetical protein
MSEVHQLLTAVCRMLALFPDVELTREQLTEDAAQIDLLVRNVDTFRDLQWQCIGANVLLEPTLRLHEAVPTPLPVRISASFEAIDDVARVGRLQLLAIHLTWRLHKLGQIPTEEANRQLRAWNGAPVVV